MQLYLDRGTTRYASPKGSITLAINPVTDYNPVQYPHGMTVSNTMTSITDRSTKPERFPFTLCCFQTLVPSAWVVTSPIFPTRDLIVTEVPLGMHHLWTDDE